MPRPPRIEYANALYHVTARGNGRADIFHCDDDRRRFLEQLRHNLESYHVILHAFALMDNHFHLLVATPDANLSRFMQRLMTSYALYARYKHGRPGHQFEGRFKGKLVESDAYLSQVSRYIHLNPVKTDDWREKPPSKQQRRLETYRWSSYLDYVRPSVVAGGDARTRPPIDIKPVLDAFGPSRPAARRAYERHVLEALAGNDKETEALMRANGHVIGSEEFIEQIRGELAARHQGEPRDADQALPALIVDPARIDQAVSRAFGVEESTLCQHGNRGGAARKVAVELARVLTGWTLRRVGQRYGGISGQAVGKIARGLREGGLPSAAQRKLARLKRDLLREARKAPRRK
jgi:putative transposase